MAEKGLGIWGYRHFVIYLAALVNRVHPAPPRHIRKSLDRLLTAATFNQPFDARSLQSTPATKPRRRRFAHESMNAICTVVYWWWRDGCFSKGQSGYDAGSYDIANEAAQTVERAALEQGASIEDLQTCAVLTFQHWDSLDNLSRHLSGQPLVPKERDQRDAALAAMESGHYAVAHDILTREDV